MYPFIRNEDVVEVEPYDLDQARVGDIILCRSDEDKAIVHRVVRRVGAGQSGYLVTRGDAARTPDVPVGHDQVLGRVVGVERRNRRFILNRGFLGWLGRMQPRVPFRLRALCLASLGRCGVFFRRLREVLG
jgi:hypothetical protein